jgi:hypothetical protein
LEERREQQPDTESSRALKQAKITFRIDKYHRRKMDTRPNPKVALKITTFDPDQQEEPEEVVPLKVMSRSGAGRHLVLSHLLRGLKPGTEVMVLIKVMPE